VGILSERKHEAFAQALFRGLSRAAAYREAGFAGDRRSAGKLAHRTDIARRVEELIERRQFLEDYTTEQALIDGKVSKLAIVQELALIGFSNIAHYMRVLPGGEPVVDLTDLADRPELWRAIKDIVVDEYVEGRGDDARLVKRTRVVLHDKRSALIDLAKMHKMIQPTTNIKIKDSAVQIVLDASDALA
jgi:phage terminase small subunit